MCYEEKGSRQKVIRKAALRTRPLNIALRR